MEVLEPLLVMARAGVSQGRWNGVRSLLCGDGRSLDVAE